MHCEHSGWGTPEAEQIVETLSQPAPHDGSTEKTACASFSAQVVCAVSDTLTSRPRAAAMSSLLIWYAPFFNL